jgi:group I intron endonuclease
MKGIIYRATNQFNGKVYIGQTVAGLARRRSQHLKDAKADHTNEFHRALYQYPESFDWEILDEFSGEPEAVIHRLNVAEEYHIIKHDSTNPQMGYNSTGGGYSSDKFAGHIARRAKALSGQSKRILQYDTDGNFVREFESLNAVAASLEIDKVQSRVLLSGLHYGYQWREKMSEIFPKKIRAYRMPMKRMVGIAVYDSNGNFIGKFKNEREAHIRFGCNGVVRDVICDINTTGAGLRGFYFFRLGDSEPPERININVKRREGPKQNPQRQMVSAYTIKGEYVETFESMSLACLKTGASHETMRRYCESPLPIAIPARSNTKYVWRYGDGDDKGNIEVVIETRKDYIKRMEHRIIQYSLDGEFIKVWDNANQAAEAGADSQGIIRKILKGGQPKWSNYIWRFFTPKYPKHINPNEVSTRSDDAIAELDYTGKTIATFSSPSDAAEKTGLSQSYICNILAGRIKHPSRRFERIGSKKS